MLLNIARIGRKRGCANLALRAQSSRTTCTGTETLQPYNLNLASACMQELQEKTELSSLVIPKMHDDARQPTIAWCSLRLRVCISLEEMICIAQSLTRWPHVHVHDQPCNYQTPLQLRSSEGCSKGNGRQHIRVLSQLRLARDLMKRLYKGHHALWGWGKPERESYERIWWARSQLHEEDRVEITPCTSGRSKDVGSHICGNTSTGTIIHMNMWMCIYVCPCASLLPQIFDYRRS